MSDYQWNARDYRKHSGQQQKWARELIAKLGLQGREAILDIGCGDGKVTAEIATSVPDGTVTGIDSSEQMVTIARQRFPQKAHPNLSFSRMDARRIDFKSRFDIVFSNAALHWVIDHRPVLEGIYRCLKPGGKMLLQMGGKGNAAGILGVIEQLKKHAHWSVYFNDFEFPYGFFSVDEYRPLLENYGFLIDRIELIPKDMEHEGRPGLEGWIRTTWLPYTERIPENLQNSFISAVSSCYLEHTLPDRNGNVHVQMVRLEVEARKPN